MYAIIYETGMISFDATLLFQIVNTLLLLLVIIGIPVLIIRFVKMSKTKHENLKEINQKLDWLINESKNDE